MSAADRAALRDAARTMIERAYRLGRRDEAEAAFEAVRGETELRLARNALSVRVAAARAVLAEGAS